MAKSYLYKGTRAILTKPTVLNGGCYPAGTKFTISEPLDKGRRRLTFDLKVGKSVILAPLNDIPYRLLTDKK
jgi:hypothetical protein